jgi:hypothetical protein
MRNVMEGALDENGKHQYVGVHFIRTMMGRLEIEPRLELRLEIKPKLY